MSSTRNGSALLIVLVIVAVLLTYWVRAQGPLGTDVRDNAVVQHLQQDTTSPADENSGADVTLFVFTDYRCPACRQAHPEMKLALSNDRRVRVVYKDWPIFGETSKRAAEVAIASSFQGIYPEVHDRLMTGPVADEDDLRSAVENSGGDWRRIEVDLQHRKAEIEDQLGRNRLQAFALGLGGTPGYLIGPNLVRGALTEAQFLRAFRDARQESQRHS